MKKIIFLLLIIASVVSCSSMKTKKNSELALQSKNNLSDLYFTDGSCTKLKQGINIMDITDSFFNKVATSITEKSYSEFRIQDYRPYQNPDIMAKRNKIWFKYSKRDNPTGIYASKVNEEIVVFVGPTKGQNINLVIQNLTKDYGYNNSTKYPLVEGANVIYALSPGLIYVENFTDDNIPLLLETEEDKARAAEKTVTIHFATGEINGYFDVQKHEEKEWGRILADASYQDIDVLGRYAHITWPVADFKIYEEKNGSTAPATLKNYDSLVYWEQDFMGVFKYNKPFNNRMYFHIDYAGKSPYATSYRTAYTRAYAEVICDTGKFAKRSWGPSHEAGHINQTRGLKWGGMTEVTNNIHSLYVQYKYTGKTKLIPDGIYNNAYAGIIDAKSPHCMAGNDYKYHEWKLVPFWQLKLYMEDVLGKTDFYKDLYEHYRISPSITEKVSNKKLHEGEMQLDFVRNVCKLSELNLLDFFEAWGFLRPVDEALNDYGNKKMLVSQEQVDKLVKEIEALNYPKPKKKVQYITEENMKQYR